MTAPPTQLGVATRTEQTVAPNLGAASPANAYASRVKNPLLDGQGSYLRLGQRNPYQVG